MSKRLFTLAALAGVAVLALLLSGCGKSDDSSQKDDSTPASNAPAVRMPRVEFMPADSDERLRRHIYGGKDGQTEVEVDIEYRDGRTAALYLREDGTLKEAREFYSGARGIKQDNIYDADGKTVRAHQEFNDTGRLHLDRELLKDGSTRTTTYYDDGKTPVKVELSLPDTTLDTTWYRKDGSLWAKSHQVAGTVVRVECYTGGKLVQLREYANDQQTITVYRDDGTVAYKQYWVKGGAGFWYPYALHSVDEYAPDGKTIQRTVVLDDNGSTAVRTEIYDNSGAKVEVHQLRDDGTVDKEQKLDVHGKVVSTQIPKKPVSEPLDQTRLKEPAFDRPTNWGSLLRRR